MIAMLARWRRFPAAERRALVAAAAMQLVCAALLRVVSFRRIVKAMAIIGTTRRAAPDMRMLERWFWAIEAAGRHLGRTSSCLARALAAQWIAGRSGVALPISIGVARGATGTLEAHAWIAGSEPRLRVGADAADRYVPLVTLDAPREP